MTALTLSVEIEKWPLSAPFRITGRTFECFEVLVVNLEHNGQVGIGEAAGVDYLNDDVASMFRQIDALRSTLDRGIHRDELQELLPPGGARNALDCALWDLQAKLDARPVWQIASLKQPRPLLTMFTCGASGPQEMAAAARAYPHARSIKLKLTGEPVDAERVRAVRMARPDVILSVDANQGFTPLSLEQVLPVLVDCQVALIEQPFPANEDALLDSLDLPIPIAADESAQCLADIPNLVGRFDTINIKLDKCGGLTEGLAMVRRSKELGLSVMVGNMGGTSLAMAPAFLVGQSCDVVDLDGPVFLKTDRATRVRYTHGFIDCPANLWGGPHE